MSLTNIEIIPFHAFFTLLMDERLMNFLQLFARQPRFFSPIFSLCRLADEPFTRHGIGNGFYFMARKERNGR